MLGERTAEEVKMTMGSAFPQVNERADETEAEIRGRDMVSGLPRTVVVSTAEIRQAMEEPLHTIVDAVRTTLDQTPPELAGDIMDRGIVLTGGGALLRGLDERLRHETGMPVHVADDPLTSVAMGAAKCVEEFEGLRQVFVERTSAATDAATSSRRAAPEPLGARRAAAGLRHADHPRLPRRHRLADGARPPGDGRGLRSGRVGRGHRRTPPHLHPRLVPHPVRPAPRDRHPDRRRTPTSASRSTPPASTATGWRSTTASPAPPSTLGQALVPARVIGIGASQTFSRTVTIDAGLEGRPRPRPDRGQRRRARRPGAAGDQHHRHRAPGHRRRVGRGRPDRGEHAARLPARPRRPRPQRPPRPRARRRLRRAQQGRRRRHVGKPAAARRTSPAFPSAGSRRSSAACGRPPSAR